MEQILNLIIILMALVSLLLVCVTEKHDITKDKVRNTHMFLDWVKDTEKKASHWMERYRNGEKAHIKTWALSGGILRTLTHYTGKGDFHNAELIDSIGRIIQYTPPQKDGLPSGDHLPEDGKYELDTDRLSQAERDAVNEWYGKFIGDKGRDPLKLLYLALELMRCDDAAEAVRKTEADFNGYAAQ